MRVLCCALIPMLLFFTCFATQAGMYGILAGRITDSTGKALAGATISIGGLARGGYTVGDGSFNILKILAGYYTVKVTCPGYQDWTRSVLIKPDSTVILNAVLSPVAESTHTKAA